MLRYDSYIRHRTSLLKFDSSTSIANLFTNLNPKNLAHLKLTDFDHCNPGDFLNLSNSFDPADLRDVDDPSDLDLADLLNPSNSSDPADLPDPSDPLDSSDSLDSPIHLIPTIHLIPLILLILLNLMNLLIQLILNFFVYFF